MAGIKLTLSNADMKAVLLVYDYMKREMLVKDEQDMLYLCHVKQLRNEVVKKLIDEKANGIKLNDEEAITFWLLWCNVNMDDVQLPPACKAVIREMLAIVDQYVQSLKPLMIHEQDLLAGGTTDYSGKGGGIKAIGTMAADIQGESPEGVASG